MKLVFRVHAIRRMFERGISDADVRHVLETGETIEDYPADSPFPSRLVLGWCGARPVHVVIATNTESDEEVVITAYQPDPGQWDAGFRRRTQG